MHAEARAQEDSASLGLGLEVLGLEVLKGQDSRILPSHRDLGKWEECAEAATHHQFLLYFLELFFTDKIFILENHLQQNPAQEGAGVGRGCPLRTRTKSG